MHGVGRCDWRFNADYSTVASQAKHHDSIQGFERETFINHVADLASPLQHRQAQREMRTALVDISAGGGHICRAFERFT